MDLLIVAFGFGVGVLIGLTGIGGGSLMTPLLILFGGVQPVVAIGTDLAYGAVTKTVGGWRHLRKGTVDLGVSKWLALGSVPGALVGAFTVDRLAQRYGQGFESALLVAVGAVLLLVSGSVLFRAVFMRKAIEREIDSVLMTGARKAHAVALGGGLGLTLGLTSVGSGALVGLVLILVFRLTPRRVVGTDVFHAAMLLWAAGLANWAGGHIDFALMGNLLAGSLPGVWIGAGVMPQVPPAALRIALGCVLLAAALGVFSKGGIPVPLVAIVGLPAAVGLGAYLLQRGRVSQPPASAPGALG